MTLTPRTLRELIERHEISQVELARRSGLARPNLHRALTCRHSPRLSTWERVVGAYHELRAEQVGRAAAEAERRGLLLASDPELARAVRGLAEAGGLSLEEWCALPGV